jgi:hypothetical protein
LISCYNFKFVEENTAGNEGAGKTWGVGSQCNSIENGISLIFLQVEAAPKTYTLYTYTYI